MFAFRDLTFGFAYIVRPEVNRNMTGTLGDDNVQGWIGEALVLQHLSDQFEPRGGFRGPSGIDSVANSA